jgi:hypothetical protein
MSDLFCDIVIRKTIHNTILLLSIILEALNVIFLLFVILEKYNEYHSPVSCRERQGEISEDETVQFKSYLLRFVHFFILIKLNLNSYIYCTPTVRYNLYYHGV